MVNWDLVCMLREEGGLNLGILVLLNKASIGKCLNGCGVSLERVGYCGLWYQVIRNVCLHHNRCDSGMSARVFHCCM